MVDVSSRNLQVRLLILVFLAFIPALGIFWYANRELRNLQLEAKEQELVQRAGEVAMEYNRLVDCLPSVKKSWFPASITRIAALANSCEYVMLTGNISAR